MCVIWRLWSYFRSAASGFVFAWPNVSDYQYYIAERKWSTATVQQRLMWLNGLPDALHAGSARPSTDGGIVRPNDLRPRLRLFKLSRARLIERCPDRGFELV